MLPLRLTFLIRSEANRSRSMHRNQLEYVVIGQLHRQATILCRKPIVFHDCPLCRYSRQQITSVTLMRRPSLASTTFCVARLKMIGTNNGLFSTVTKAIPKCRFPYASVSADNDQATVSLSSSIHEIISAARHGTISMVKDPSKSIGRGGPAMVPAFGSYPSRAGRIIARRTREVKA